MANLTIVGCGNANRSDDGVGVFIAQRLQQELARSPRAGVRVFDAGTGGMDVMFQARGADALVVVDACRTGAEAGTVFEVPGAEFAGEREPSFTLHDFRWDHALAAGRRIFKDQFPRSVTVYLIEAGSVALGLELSAPVRAAADRVLDTLRQRMDERAPVDDGALLRVRDGNLYLSREIRAAHFDGARTVALLQRDGDVLLVPLMPDSPGGLLLKQRNARGDTVIHAQEFLREHGFAEDAVEQRCRVQWSGERAALVVTGLRRA